MKGYPVGEAAVEPMLAAGRPVRYLNSGKDDKQQIALEIAAADRVSEGPICALTAVELCRSYALRRDKETGKPDLKSENCVSVLMDPVKRGGMAVAADGRSPYRLSPAG